MGREVIDDALGETKGAIKKIKASAGRLQGSFYYAGDAQASSVGMIVTLSNRDKKGTRAHAQGKAIRKEIKGAKFARGTVSMDKGKLIFVWHSGTAAPGVMQKAFKKTLASEPGLRVLKSAIIRKQGDATEMTVDADGAAEDEANIRSEAVLTEEEQSDLDALLEEVPEAEQVTLAALNEDLSAFLSEDESAEELAEQIADQLKALMKLEQERPQDPDKIRDAKAVLGEFLQYGDTPFPQPPATLDPLVATVMAESARLLGDHTGNQREDSGKYQQLMAQIEGQISTITALFGVNDPACVTLRNGIVEAQRAVLTAANPPDYRAGASVLYPLIKDGSRLTKDGINRYNTQREAEATEEARRLRCVQGKLQRENELREFTKGYAKLQRLAGSQEDQSDALRAQCAALLENAERSRQKLTLDTLAAISKPLHKPVRTEDRTALTAAERLLSTLEEEISNWRAGLMAIEAGIQRDLKQLTDDAATSALMADYTLLIQALDQENHLSYSVVAEFRSQAEAVRAALLAGLAQEQPERAQITQAQQNRLALISNQLMAARAEQTQQRQTSAELMGNVQAAIQALALVALAADLIPFEQRRQTLQGQIENRDFTDLRSLSDALVKDMDDRKATLISHQQAWAALRPEDLQLQLQTLAAMDSDPARPLTLPHPLQALNSELLVVMTAVTQRTMSYEDGATALRTLKGKLDANLGAIEGLPALNESIEEWSGQVETNFGLVKTALDALDAKVSDAGVLQQIRAPFEARRDELRARWGAASGDLVERTEPEVVRIIWLLWALEKDIQTASSTGLDALLLTAGNDNAIKMLEDARAEGVRICDALQMLGEIEEADKRQALNVCIQAGLDLDDDTAAMLTHHTSVVTPFMTQLRAFLVRAEESAQALKNQVASLNRDALADLATFRSSVESHITGLSGAWNWLTRDLKPEYQAYIVTLTAELNELQPMVAANYPGLLKNVMKLLHAFRADVQEATLGLNDHKVFSEETKEKEEASMNKLRAKITQTRAEMKTNELHKYYKVEYDKIDGELSSIIEALGTKLLASLRTEYNSVVTGLKMLMTKREGDIVARVTLQTQLDAFVVAIDREPIKDFDSITSELNPKILNAAQQLKTGGDIDQARIIISEISNIIARTDSGPQLASMVRELDIRDNERAQLQAEWETTLADFTRSYFEPFQTIIGEGMTNWQHFSSFFVDPEKVKDIRTLLSTAKDSASKSDFQMASYQITLAKSRIAFYERFPDGQNAHMIETVAKLPKLWRGAVAKFQAQVDQTASGVEAFLGENEPSAVAAIHSATSQLRSLFHSDAFDQIANIPEENADRLKWRERSLAEVRRLRGLVSDPRIIILEKHPFPSAPDFSGHYEIEKTLMDFEKTILLSANSNA